MRTTITLPGTRPVHPKDNPHRNSAACFFLFALFPFLIHAGHGQTENVLSANDLVKGLEDAAHQRTNVQFDFETKTYIENPTRNGSFLPNETAQGVFARNDEQIDLQYTVTSAAASPAAKTISQRFLITGGNCFIDSSLPSENNKLEQASVAPDSENAARDLWSQPYPGSFLEGHLKHVQGDWAGILNSPQNPQALSLHGTQDVDGTPCAVLEANTTSGDYTLWIDKDNGFVVRKATVVVGPEDHFLNGKLADFKFAPQLSRPGMAAPKLTRVEYTVDNVKATRVGEDYLASGGTLTERMVFSTGTSSVSRVVTARSKILPNLGPEASSLFTVDWPDGTAVVGMDGYQGKQFVWSGGRLNPAESSKAAGKTITLGGQPTAAQSTTTIRSSSTKYIAVAIVAALGVLILFFLFHRGKSES